MHQVQAISFKCFEFIEKLHGVLIGVQINVVTGSDLSFHDFAVYLLS